MIKKQKQKQKQKTTNKQTSKKKRTCQIVNLAVPTYHRGKLKESVNKDKYLDLAKEVKKTVEHEKWRLYQL